MIEHDESFLRPYQLEGVNFMDKNDHVLNFDDMGLGKTVSTLVSTLRKINPGDKVIVLCPTKALFVWQNEIKKWYPELTSVVYWGTPAKRKKIDISAQYVITTYGMAMELLDRALWAAMICDEIHEAGLLNHKSKTFLDTVKFRKKVKYSYLLTGTPIRQGVIDCYAPLHFVDPDRFQAYWGFINRYCIVNETPFGKQVERNPKNIPAFRKMLDEYMIRRLKSEVLQDLPGKQRQVIPVPMTPKQRKAHDKLLEEFMYEYDDGVVLAQTAMTSILKCRQLLVTPRLLGIDEDGAALEYLKMESKSLMDQCVPFVVFTPFRQAIPYIEQALRSVANCKIYKLAGGMTPAGFANEWQGFQEYVGPMPKVLICVIKSGASFHATCASICFFLGAEFDFNYNVQSEDRLCRLGQKDFVQCRYVMHEHSVDDLVKAKLNAKNNSSTWIVGTEQQYQHMLELLKGLKRN